MGLLQKVVIDCSVPGGAPTVAPLSDSEQADYTAQQPIGAAEVAALAALAARRAQHVNALAALTPHLTASAATTANDITAVQAIIDQIQSGQQPTAAQVLQITRFLLRTIAVLLS